MPERKHYDYENSQPKQRKTEVLYLQRRVHYKRVASQATTEKILLTLCLQEMPKGIDMKMIKVLINLEPDQKDWAKAQMHGMAAYIRWLITCDMARNEDEDFRGYISRTRRAEINADKS